MKTLVKNLGLSALLLLASLTVVAEDKTPKVSPLSKEEVIMLRTDQLNKARTENALQGKLLALPEFSAAQQAANKLEEDKNKIFATRKLTGNDAILCEGPYDPRCVGVERDELVLVPLPKPEEKKAEEKKPEEKKPEAAKK